MFWQLEGYMWSSLELKKFIEMLWEKRTIHLLKPSDSDDGWSDDWTKPQKWGMKCSIKKLPVSQDGKTSFRNEAQRREDESVVFVIEEIKWNPSDFFQNDTIMVGGEFLLDMLRISQLTNQLKFEQMEEFFSTMNIHAVVDSTQQRINQMLNHSK